MPWRKTIEASVAGLCAQTAALLLATSVAAGESRIPWSEHVDPSRSCETIHTIATEAKVSVSDGLTYEASSVFHDRQRAVFRSQSADESFTVGIDGRYIWSFDGQVEREAGASVEDFVLGHQIHAQLLFFRALHDSLSEPVADRFEDSACFALSSAGDSPWTVYYAAEGRPLGMRKQRPDEPSIQFRFDAWRDVDGFFLPHEVRIDDGERQFVYRYVAVRLNRGSMSAFRAADSVLTDEQKLLRLHRQIMDDHFFGRADAMKAMSADTVVVVSAGEVQVFSRPDWNAQVDQIRSSRDYFVYDDRIRPVVRVSPDGNLGWVMVQVSAAGVRLGSDGQVTEPLEFVSAWIELYEKIDGQWRMAGNVSNFKPHQ